MKNQLGHDTWEARVARQAERDTRIDALMTPAFGPIVTCNRCLGEFRSTEDGEIHLCANCDGLEKVSALSHSYGQHPQSGDIGVLYRDGRYKMYDYLSGEWMHSTDFTDWVLCAERLAGRTMVLGSNGRAFYRQAQEAQ